jgi:hypothetical protein
MDGNASILSSHWHVEGDAIVGELKLQTCQATRKWTTSEVRITKHDAPESPVWIGLGLGALTSLVSAVSWKHDLIAHCPSLPEQLATMGPPPRCTFEKPDNTFPEVMLGASVAFWTMGIIASAQHDYTTEEVLGEKQHATAGTEPCLGATDLAELLLVARGPSGQLWPVRLLSSVEARIPLPQSPDVPRDVEIDLVVHRAPRTLGGLLHKGDVLDTFKVDSAPGSESTTTPP